MAWPFNGGYGIPPFGDPYSQSQPGLVVVQTPYKEFDVSTSEFALKVWLVPKVEAGQAVKMTAYFAHYIDGACGGTGNPFTSGPTISILDGNGIAVPTAVVQGVVLGTVTAQPSASGVYFSVVQLGASMQPGSYVVQWTASYTPVNNQEPHVALPIQIREPFVVTVTKSPSRFIFRPTDQW